jgi:hypothetical protein
MTRDNDWPLHIITQQGAVRCRVRTVCPPAGKSCSAISSSCILMRAVLAR